MNAWTSTKSTDPREAEFRFPRVIFFLQLVSIYKTN
nr:MAG TPA: hypothetical protein [Caudoviricetes sp.]